LRYIGFGLKVLAPSFACGRKSLLSLHLLSHLQEPRVILALEEDFSEQDPSLLIGGFYPEGFLEAVFSFGGASGLGLADSL
jgi:hypothetical protein